MRANTALVHVCPAYRRLGGGKAWQGIRPRVPAWRLRNSGQLCELLKQTSKVILAVLCAYMVDDIASGRRCMRAKTGRLTGALPEVVPVIHQVAHVDWWVVNS